MRAGSVVIVVAGISLLVAGCGGDSVRLANADARKDTPTSQGADGPGADKVLTGPDAPAADVPVPVEVAQGDAPADVPITDVALADRPPADGAASDGVPSEPAPLDGGTPDGASVDAGYDAVAGEAGPPSPRSTKPPFDNCPGAFPHARLAVDEEGTLYVGLICYVSGDTGPLRIVLMVSHDRGASFDGPWPVVDLDGSYTAGGASQTRALLAAGPAGQVYVATPNSGGVLFVRSTDAGKTWPSSQQLPPPLDSRNLQLVATGDAVGVGPTKSTRGGVASVMMSSDRGASLVELTLDTVAPVLLADAKMRELLVVSSGRAAADAGAYAPDADVLQAYHVTRFANDTRTLDDVGTFLRAGTISRWGANDGTLYALVGGGVWRAKPDGTTDGSFVPCPGQTVDFVVEASGSVILHVSGTSSSANTESLVRWDESAGACSGAWTFSTWSYRFYPGDVSFIPLTPAQVALTWNSTISAGVGVIQFFAHSW